MHQICWLAYPVAWFIPRIVLMTFPLIYTPDDLHSSDAVYWRRADTTNSISNNVTLLNQSINVTQNAQWHLLVHGQVTIIFVVPVCLSVCLCRVFLSRLWSDFDQTRTYVICLGLVVSPRIQGVCTPGGWVTPKKLAFLGVLGLEDCTPSREPHIVAASSYDIPSYTPDDLHSSDDVNCGQNQQYQ